MKNLFKVLALVFAVTFIFSSCKKKVEPIHTNQVEDGYYVVGNSIFADSMQLANAMVAGTVDDGNFGSKLRDGLYYKFMYVTTAGDGFVVKQQKGTETITWGLDGSLSSEITDTATVGKIVQNGVNFTVPKDGFYMFVIDFKTSKVHIYSVIDWGVVGDMNGWSDEPAMTLKSIDKEKASWEITGVKMTTKNKYKFRFNHTWNYKIASTDGMVQSNLGGAIDALTQGGKNLPPVDADGIYTITLNWNFATGFTSTNVKTGNYTPPTYPDSLYVVGGSSMYGWNFVENGLMHKIAGGGDNEGIFWKICYLADTSNGFKIAEKGWKGVNIGFNEVNKFDANGVTVSNNSGNMTITTGGLYMIVLNLRNDSVKLSVTAPKVYGIGDAFGGWGVDSTANLFSVDNSTLNIVSPALSAAGDIRMYASHAWIPAWWNAEFIVDGGKIVYRNDGGDQTRIQGTAGQTITLHFDDNTGSIQ